MRSFLNSIWILLLAVSLAAAQTPAQTPAKTPAKTRPPNPRQKLGTHATPDLPSEATVDSFLHQTVWLSGRT